MGRRTVLIAVALLVAALGTGLVFLYVRGVNDRALARQEPVQVLVAKDTITAGTSVREAASRGNFQLRTIPRAGAVPTALASVTPIQDKIAIGTIFAGEQILPAKFGTSANTSGLAIPAGKMAVSVQLSDPARVAGFVQPGSQVAVFATIAAPTGPGNQANQPGEVTGVLLQQADVIAVGPATSATTAAAGSGSGSGAVPDNAGNQEQVARAVLTLALTDVEATKLIFASQKGQLYLALRTANSTFGPGNQVSLGSLFG